MYNAVIDKKKTHKDKKRDGRDVTELKASKARVTTATKVFKKNEVGDVLGKAPAEFVPGKKQKPGQRFLLSIGERQEWVDEQKLEAVK